MEWNPSRDSANYTSSYVFNQLIPYIGNKRKLLGLIKAAIDYTGVRSLERDFIDLFAGTGVVSRYAKSLGFRVIANDWEPYSEAINRCYIEASQAPLFGAGAGKTYEQFLRELNALEPKPGWVTNHLCPDNDESFDIKKDRLFYTRQNGMKIDAIREQLMLLEQAKLLSEPQKWAVLAPLLYQCSYNSNTSGVFKGFHNGWGGLTRTALYRIRGELSLRPAAFFDNGWENLVFREDAATLAPAVADFTRAKPIVYIDPPYNQHPYGSNYHVLNSVALWDKPALSPKITGHGDKSAIRHDWRTARRSAYNHRGAAADAYRKLLNALPDAWCLTSYSTDGTIPLETLVEINCTLGDVAVFSRPYKRYRVSSQRFSEKPMNVEFILATNAGTPATRSVDEIVAGIYAREAEVIDSHPETIDRERQEIQMELLYGE